MYVALKLCNKLSVFAKFGMDFMAAETFPASLFSLLHCFISGMAVVQACGMTPLLEASPETITWSRPSKNEQAFIETFFWGGGFGCYLNCTQIFNLLFDAGNECAPKARHVRFGTEIDHKHIYRFSVRYCVCVQTWWLHETIRMPERFAVN